MRPFHDIFYSLLHAIVHKFPNIFVHDSYTVRHHFEKVQLLESWAASANQIARNIIVTSKVILRLDNTKNTKESPNPTCTSNRQQH